MIVNKKSRGDFTPPEEVHMILYSLIYSLDGFHEILFEKFLTVGFYMKDR